jgi:hypothetical protein
MDLYTPPFDLEIELLPQLFDDAFADVAEGSDVIGKNFNVNTHGTPPIRQRDSTLIISGESAQVVKFFVFPEAPASREQGRALHARQNADKPQIMNARANTLHSREHS